MFLNRIARAVPTDVGALINRVAITNKDSIERSALGCSTMPLLWSLLRLDNGVAINMALLRSLRLANCPRWDSIALPSFLAALW
jgi:hypothetical protein